MNRFNSLISIILFSFLLIVFLGCPFILPDTYTVIFDTDGGSMVNNQIIQKNDMAIRPTPNPTKPGYSFENWYAEDNFITLWNFNNPITDDTTVYAHWSADTYRVTFDSQSADTEAIPTSETVTSPATTIDQLPTAPTKTGYTFGGWYTATEGGGTEFTISSIVTSDTTVYAHWIADTYRVTFDSQSADTEASPTSETVTSPATTIDQLPTAPTKTGYTFVGWYTATEGGGTEFTTSSIVTGDITVYAHWTVRPLTRDELITMISDGDDVTNADTSSITDMSNILGMNSTFNQDISNWDVSSVTNMSYMFHRAEAFNQDISSWDVSNVTDMSRMFNSAFSFNQDLSDWDVTSVTDITYMFNFAKSFNGDISDWDVSNITNMDAMFYGAESFNGDLSDWDVSNVTNMSSMFYGADDFNQDLLTWDVSGVTTMKQMFWGAESFNGDITAWDVSNVTTMYGMFGWAFGFNGDISAWDVSNVTNMFSMFYRNSVFNQDISSWDVSDVTDMEGMFRNASVFNQDISSWDVANVTTMDYMFSYASFFNQDISSWVVSSVEDRQYRFSWECPLLLEYHPSWE